MNRRLVLALAMLTASAACPTVRDAGEGEGEGEFVAEGEGDVGEGEGDVGEGEGEGEGEETRCLEPGVAPESPCEAGLGLCRRAGELHCVNADILICTAEAALPEVDVDTTDDGVDEDCDGAVDDDTCLVDPQRGAECTAGVGACRTSGALECDRNALTCGAVAGAPLASDDDTDDGVDDDCDGVVDEDVIACDDHPQLGQPCFAGVGACRREGTFDCNDADDTVACNAEAAVPTEVIDDDDDGVDDDCDGAADEDGAAPTRTPCDPAGACCFANVFTVPRQTFFHVDVPPGAPPSFEPDCTDARNQLNWQSNPPASGPHLGCSWGSWDSLYDETGPLPRGYWIHNVEHGGAIFLWGPDATDAARTELLAAFQTLAPSERCGHSLAVATFDPALPEPVAVVVVDRVLLPDASGVIPRAAAMEFAVSCRDAGPERVCFRGPPIHTGP